MKKILFIIILFNINISYAFDKLIVSTGEWSPFVSEKIPGHGSAASKLTLALEQQNIDVEFKFFPWKRAYAEALDAYVDGSLPWRKSPDREKDFLFSEPLICSDTHLYHNVDNPITWSEYEDLKEYIIAGTLGYSYDEEFDQYAKDNPSKYDATRSDIINLKKLLAGRVDAFVCSVDVCDILIEDNFSPENAEKLKPHPRVVNSSYYNFMISKKHPKRDEIIKVINKGL